LNEVHKVAWCGVDNLWGNGVDYYGLPRWGAAGVKVVVPTVVS